MYGFVREALQSDWLPFELLASGGQKLSEDENLALNECGLVSVGPQGTADPVPLQVLQGPAQPLRREPPCFRAGGLGRSLGLNPTFPLTGNRALSEFITTTHLSFPCQMGAVARVS